jgi:hypothetical protein
MADNHNRLGADHSVRNVRSSRSIRSSPSRQFGSSLAAHPSHTHTHLQDILGTSPLAQQAIERDLQDEPEDVEEALDDSDSDLADELLVPRQRRESIDHSFVGSYVKQFSSEYSQVDAWSLPIYRQITELPTTS